MKFHRKNNELKKSQKKFSTKFLVELQGAFMEFFWTRNYVNYQSELFTRDHIYKKIILITSRNKNAMTLKICFGHILG